MTVAMTRAITSRIPTTAITIIITFFFGDGEGDQIAFMSSTLIAFMSSTLPEIILKIIRSTKGRDKYHQPIHIWLSQGQHFTIAYCVFDIKYDESVLS